MTLPPEYAWAPEEARATRTLTPSKASSAREQSPHRAHFQVSRPPRGAHLKDSERDASHAHEVIEHWRRRKRGVLHAATLAAVALTMAGCNPPERSSDPNARVGGSLTSMDYEPTDTFVRPVYVNGRGGDSAGTGGSTVLSAISLPQRWHPGLTVHVRWRRCARGTFYVPGVPQNEGCRWVEKDVPAHPYTYVGRTWLHIFADDEVLVIPSMKGPNHPDYPGAESPYKSFNKRRGIGRDE